MRTELTQRERQILEMMWEGKGSKEIARVLETSVKTIETQRCRLYRFIGVGSVVEALRWGLKKGYLKPVEPERPPVSRPRREG